MVEIVEIMMSPNFYFHFISPKACFYIFRKDLITVQYFPKPYRSKKDLKGLVYVPIPA
jgi:hypothetical protein